MKYRLKVFTGDPMAAIHANVLFRVTRDDHSSAAFAMCDPAEELNWLFCRLCAVKNNVGAFPDFFGNDRFNFDFPVANQPGTFRARIP